MQESAFVNPPWMLDREGSGYVQVTELLYRVAEQCNGECDLNTIAQRVSAATGRNVSADNVKTLIAKQLLPKGLVQTADGKAVAVEPGARSPLQIGMKMAMVGPEAIEPITKVLQVLFWPPVLIVVLVAAGIAQAWMYFVHGVGGSFRDALYAPGLMLISLGAIVLAAGLHELGHAAALRYGGGKVRGMGAGIYVVYPAFYTDVSDNYRLPRWSRVRTDLGGFYFNLIFVLAVMGLYVLTGHEILLLIVVLVNLEIVHQLMPLGRLDGYWTLADITGVPDFLSQMGAFLRRYLPFTSNDGHKLPELKWWAKAVFGLYMLIVIPLLGFLLFITLKNMPTILATAWDSVQQQIGTLISASSQGDLVGVGGAVVQIVALGLPILGLFYTFFNLGRRGAVAVWNWSRPTPTRRAIGGLGTVGAAAALVYVWAPQLPFSDGGPGPAYRYTQSNFQPISREARGTVFDAVGAPSRAPAPVDGGASPTPAASPAPGAPTDVTRPTLGATLAPTTSLTAVPTSAPAAGTAVPTAGPGAPPIKPAQQPVAPPVQPVTQPVEPPGSTEPPAPTAGPSTPGVTQPSVGAPTHPPGPTSVPPSTRTDNRATAVATAGAPGPAPPATATSAPVLPRFGATATPVPPAR